MIRKGSIGDVLLNMINKLVGCHSPMIVLVAHDETKLVCESCDVERVKADGN